MAKKIELKNEGEELKKGVQCVSCKNSNHKIVDRKVYCILKKKWMSAFAVDCFKYVKLFILLLFLVSCTKDKSYSFTSTAESDFKYDVCLNEYSETDDVVNSVIINDVVKYKEYSFIAVERTEKVKIQLKVYRPDEVIICWVNKVYFIEDDNKIIFTNDNTFSYQEP